MENSESESGGTEDREHSSQQLLEEDKVEVSGQANKEERLST